MKYFQAKSWLLTCLAHVSEINHTEKLDRMCRQLEETDKEISEDDESPHHQYT